MTASDVLVESLIDWGVDVIFGLPGDGINGFVEALRTHSARIRYVHVRHEETAAMAATGYAKFTGKLGVCFSTAVPGAAGQLPGGRRSGNNTANRFSVSDRPTFRGLTRSVSN